MRELCNIDERLTTDHRTGELAYSAEICESVVDPKLQPRMVKMQLLDQIELGANAGNGIEIGNIAALKGMQIKHCAKHLVSFTGLTQRRAGWRIAIPLSAYRGNDGSMHQVYDGNQLHLRD